MTRRAVFLDRDGVLIKDVGMVTKQEEVNLFAEAPQALKRLQVAGFAVVVITNQPVVAKGLASEKDLFEIHTWIKHLVRDSSGAEIDRFYFCPHHPSSDLPQYRSVCPCRKPKPGLIIRAADEMGLDLPGSFMVGDRPTDIAAGSRAGCRTILVETGKHTEPPIETGEASETWPEPTYTCAGIREAADFIVGPVPGPTA